MVDEELYVTVSDIRGTVLDVYYGYLLLMLLRICRGNVGHYSRRQLVTGDAAEINHDSQRLINVRITLTTKRRYE